MNKNTLGKTPKSTGMNKMAKLKTRKALIILISILYIIIIQMIIRYLIEKNIENKFDDNEVFIVEGNDYIIIKDDEDDNIKIYPFKKIDYDYEIVDGINYSDLPNDIEAHEENHTNSHTSGNFDENGDIILDNDGYYYGDIDDPKLYNFTITDYKDENDLKEKVYTVVSAELQKNVIIGKKNSSTTDLGLGIWKEKIYTKEILNQLINEYYNINVEKLSDEELNYIKWQYIKDVYTEYDSQLYLNNNCEWNMQDLYDFYSDIASYNNIEMSGEEYYNSCNIEDQVYYNSIFFTNNAIDKIFEYYNKYN